LICFCTLVDGDGIEINVESLEDVKTVTLKRKASDTIKSLKSKIQAQEGIDINDQRLIFNSEILGDVSTLSSYNITFKMEQYYTSDYGGKVIIIVSTCRSSTNLCCLS
jgi:ubiquitin